MAAKSVDSCSHGWTASSTFMCLLASLRSMFVLVWIFSRVKKSRIPSLTAFCSTWSTMSSFMNSMWRSTKWWNLHQEMHSATISSLKLGNCFWTIRTSFQIFFHLTLRPISLLSRLISFPMLARCAFGCAMFPQNSVSSTLEGLRNWSRRASHIQIRFLLGPPLFSYFLNLARPSSASRSIYVQWIALPKNINSRCQTWSRNWQRSLVPSTLVLSTWATATGNYPFIRLCKRPSPFLRPMEFILLQGSSVGPQML